jgi:2-amino-4-hydroxy-6-hydroxymethyldihydropteridine diphosphokinase
VSLRIGYLSLGSNLGDRREYLQAALEDLWAHGAPAITSSSVYETEPVGEVTEQPEFFNAVVEMETSLDPEALLDACKAVEAALGRTPEGDAGYVRHGPRPIDIDILVLGDEPYASERLRIPHPALAERRFVLEPLAEIAPELEIPGVGRPGDALERLDPGQGVRRAGPPLELRE